ncbi:FAD-dependent oxidoreductase [Candidatus Daviesbacteria bacterium]|nr:FAD-dependent oxidoreductase [Candidatus Daviesbacteria bacterium]
MKIAVLGAGFTGLTAALRLLQQGHEVTIFEKESSVGGLAGGFKRAGWDWTLEKSYHHFFTNDSSAYKLAKELNHPLITVRPKTDVYVQKNIVPFDSPASILSFPYLSLKDKLSLGLGTLYLKVSPHQKFEGQLALPWINKVMGKRVTKMIWQPLFQGKFGKYANQISLTWFWARIKKRTTELSYPEGGFDDFAQKLSEKIKSLGGQILLNNEVISVHSNEKLIVETKGNSEKFDKIIVTLPSPVFTKITSKLPRQYVKRISSIPHLCALTLVLILKKPFLDGTYWLNITDPSFPFLALVEHTNFMPIKHYGREHILYIGNYLQANHTYLKMSAKELLKIYDPYLKKINPHYTQYMIHNTLFVQPHAQPVVTTDYPKLMPEFITPLENVYLANMDMVYPWDRGTNYAIELGESVINYLTSL